MDKNIEIHILPEVDEFLKFLAEDLIKGGYKSNLYYATKMVDDIIDFIYEIPNVVHYHIPQKFQYHFERYGKNLQYACFKRKSSPQTTWYIFFEKKDNHLLIKHISNNLVEGQYIRE